MNRGPQLRLAALWVLLVGCAGHAGPVPEPDWSRCANREADVHSLARVQELEGIWALAVDAATGEKRGERATGAMTLVPGDSTGAPLYGWTDIALPAVGAQEVGSPSATDRDAPGVLVLTVPDVAVPAVPVSVTLRLGSLANQRGMLRFDGAWTALYVRWIGDDGFGGEWTSGVTMPGATGTFCAARRAAP